MILKWIIVIAIIYYVYKRHIALPSGEQNLKNLKNKNATDHKKASNDDDYIDYEEV